MSQDNSAPAGARRIRPNMPNYGVLPEQVDGMLSWDWVVGQIGAGAQLQDRHNQRRWQPRIAFPSGAHGWMGHSSSAATASL